MRRGPKLQPTVLTTEESTRLAVWTRRLKTSQALAMRARTVLSCQGDRSNGQIAQQLRVTPQTVGKWRTRFARQRLDGLLDEPRPGAPRTIDDVMVEQGCGRESGSAGLVLLFNILHIEDPVNLLMEAHRALRPGGMVAVIHWNHDIRTPRGPPLDIRPRPEQCRAWGEQAGLRWVRDQALPGSLWHWGMVLEKP